jgi:hypothetical protein
MLRQIDSARFDRVVVDVIELLPHHRLALDALRVAPLLPKLVIRLSFVRSLEEGEQIEQSLGPDLLQMVDDPPCGTGLEPLGCPC